MASVQTHSVMTSPQTAPPASYVAPSVSELPATQTQSASCDDGNQTESAPDIAIIIPSAPDISNPVSSRLSELDSIHHITRRQVLAGSAVVEVWEQFAFDLNFQHILACHTGTKRHHSTGKAHILEDYVLDAIQDHTPLLACALVLALSFPIGFFLGVCPLTGAGEYVHPFTIGLMLCCLAGWAVAWERILLFWAVRLWAVWAFAFWAPLQLLFSWLSRGHRYYESLYVLFMVFSVGVTVPWPFVVMKLCNYKFCSLIRPTLNVCACLALQTGGVILVASVVIFDSFWLSKSEHVIARVLRPFIRYTLTRIAHIMFMVGMSFHPSPLFRITYLLFGYMFLTSLETIGASQSRSWGALFYYLGTGCAGRLMALYALAISGTELERKYSIFPWIKWACSVGGPTPYHGMDAMQYSCLSKCVRTLCSLASVCGALMLWFGALRWLDSGSAIGPSVNFWFPQGDTSAIMLLVLLAREVLYDWLTHNIATYKTGIKYRSVFACWLDDGSCVGWSTLFGIALASALGPGGMTIFSHFQTGLTKFAAQFEL